MRRLLLIGIGAGDPDHLTLQAARALGTFDVLFVVTKEDGPQELVSHRRQLVKSHRGDRPFRTVELSDPPRPWRDATDYGGEVGRWRTARVELWEAAVGDQLGDGECGAFLVWGDPSLYESTLTVVEEIRRRATFALEFEVIPGVSSVHALTARHRISLNRVGSAVQITPARLLANGMPEDVDDVVVMLDPGAAFARIPADDLDIYWGAYLGTPDELLISGALADVSSAILAEREDAKRRKGWIFDIYLLRRRRR
ncbi:MAG: precorrin-6A synthase (deacetylating) [Actinomycetota bacterium]|nr:precorrin-6A synthase (deacetylating) [Actinomycetota bacterium]